MWFDPYAQLAEIVGHPPATSATTATQVQPARPVSQMSRVSQGADAEKPSTPANVASVATPQTFPHGLSFAGSPVTWTGRVVSLDEWRRLTAWERHGPEGRRWCGINQNWTKLKGN